MFRYIILTICILFMSVFVKAQETDTNEYNYEVVSQLGLGRIGNAAFSPDSSQLVVASSIGIKIYDLTKDIATLRVNDSVNSHPFNTGAIFVAYSQAGESLIYLEARDHVVNEGVYWTGLVNTVNIWQADIDDLDSAEMVATINLSIQLNRIPNSLADASLWQSVEDAIGMELWEQQYLDDNAETLISPDARWAWNYNEVRENYRFDNDVQETIWYDIVHLADNTVVISSLDDVDRLSVSIKADGRLLWQMNDKLQIIESLRCGTGVEWHINDNSLNELQGYGGCGDNRSCPTPFGNFCIFQVAEEDGTPAHLNRTNITVVYDMFYLWDNPDEEKEAFSYIATGHTDGIIFLSGFYPDTIMSGAVDGTTIIWDVVVNETDFAMDSRLQLEHANPVTFVGFTPDANIMTTSGGDIFFWDAETGTLLGYLEGHNEPIMRVAWSPNGEQFATASSDGVVLIWEQTR